MKVSQLCLTLCDPMDYTVHGILQARMLEWVGSLSLLQEIFPTQGSDPCLLHCGQILYQLSHKGSPRILEWVAYPFSSGSSRPRNRTGVSCISGGFFTNWAMREAQDICCVRVIKQEEILILFDIRSYLKLQVNFLSILLVIYIFEVSNHKHK